MLTISLTTDEAQALVQVMNAVSGMENAKILLPIYEKIKQAATIPPPPVEE